MKRIALWVGVETPYVREMALGVCQYVKGREDWIVRGHLSGESALRICRQWPADGLIVAWPDIPVTRLLRLNLPTVMLQSYRLHGPKATWAAAAPSSRVAALDHFRERGFTHVALVIGSSRSHVGFEAEAAGMGLRAACLTLPADRDGLQLAGDAAFLTRVIRWLGRLPKPLGLIVASAPLARAIVERCSAAGLRVPQDVALLVWESDELDCMLSHPGLSHLKFPAAEIGYAGASLLNEMLCHPDRHAPAPVEIAGQEIVTRESSDVFAVDDPVLKTATDFIRAHACDPVTVGDVARAVGAAERTLDRHFRRALKCSALDVIHSCRLDRIKSLLHSTDLPIKLIAARCGFRQPEKMMRFFKEHVGRTPTQHRLRRA